MRIVFVVALALGACSAGVRTQYRGTPPSPCGGARPYDPSPKPRSATIAMGTPTDCRSRP